MRRPKPAARHSPFVRHQSPRSVRAAIRSAKIVLVSLDCRTGSLVTPIYKCVAFKFDWCFQRIVRLLLQYDHATPLQRLARAFGRCQSHVCDVAAYNVTNVWFCDVVQLSFWVSLLSLVRVKCLCEDSSAPLENGLLEQRKAILMHSAKSRLETTANLPLIIYILLVIRSFWNRRCDEQRWTPGRNVEEQILAQDKLYSLDLTCIPSRGTTRSNRWKTNNESSASPQTGQFFH